MAMEQRTLSTKVARQEQQMFTLFHDSQSATVQLDPDCERTSAHAAIARKLAADESRREYLTDAVHAAEQVLQTSALAYASEQAY